MTESSLINAPGRRIDALGNHYTIESHLLSTRSADAYKAVDRSSSNSATLWMLRHPLNPKSEAVDRFLARIQSIQHLQPAVANIQSFGVDEAGMAFVAMPNLDGVPVAAGNVELSEAERRFMSCVRFIEKLHSQGLVCGDLCGSSFWVERNGDMRFIGVMGSFDSEAAATAMLPPMETLHFVSPEQRSGGGIELASDVFALGVLGYFMMTGSYPYGSTNNALVTNFDVSKVRPLSALIQNAPAWADEVFMKCLNPQADQRYPNARELMRGIVEVRERVMSGKEAPVRTQRDAVLSGKPSTGRIAVQTIRTKAPPGSPEPEPAPEPKRQLPQVRPWVLAVVLIGIVGSVLVGSFLADRSTTGSAGDPNMDAFKEVDGSKGVKEAINVLGEKGVSDQEKQAQLEKLANSDDPLAHNALVTRAREARTEQDRLLSEKAIIDRARRLGLMRASEQVRQWLRTLKSEEIPAGYDAVLKSLDTTLPMDARNAVIKQVYTSNQKLALRLAAALALDSAKPEEYQPILAQLMADYLKIDDTQGHSILGLIFINSELANSFGDDVIQRREQLPDKDVLWLLRILADRNDSNVRAIANLAIERNLLPPLRGSFLALIRDRNDIPSEVLAALIRASAGSSKAEDVLVFGRWYDTASEKVLFGVCADTLDRALLTEAFDTLAGKSLVSEPSASLVNWVRSNAWDRRAEYAHAIGVIANVDILGIDELKRAFESFDELVKNPTFLELLLAAKEPEISRLVVERYSDNLGMGGLINLLQNPDKGVRINSIRKLKDVNEIAVLRLIIDRYEAERDPDVKQAYRENFWVIRQRDAKK